jgi:hypothetical protein
MINDERNSVHASPLNEANMFGGFPVKSDIVIKEATHEGAPNSCHLLKLPTWQSVILQLWTVTDD